MKFNENQLKAINSVHKNTAVIAAPGSGKTLVLTNRIVKLVEEYNVNPANILAVTFSRKAKDNMETRLKTMINSFSSVNIETFHSLALKIINSKYGSKFKLWDIQWQKDKVVSDIFSDVTRSKIDDDEISKVFVFIKMQKNNMRSPEDEMIEYKGSMYSCGTLKEIYKRYEDYKTINGLIEFDDFLNLACKILVNDDLLINNYRSKFKYILSDEYQDVSMNQNKLISLLGKGNNVFIVGDMLQAIYGFSGGKSEYLIDFDQEWDNVSVINLDTNYRCSKDIVDSSNKFAECIPESRHRNYIKNKSEKQEYAKPIYTEYKNSYDEGVSIAEKIKEERSLGHKYEDIAILARTNGQLQKFESILKDNRIPFNIVDGKSMLELKENKILISYLKLSENIYDNDSFYEIYNKPNRWLDKKFIKEVENISKNGDSLYLKMDSIARRNWRYKAGINEIYKIINSLKNNKYNNVSGMIKYLRKNLNIDSFVTKGESLEDGIFPQIENMDSFQELCKQFKTIKEMNIYINEMKDYLSSKNVVNSGVNLLTLHKSKGLEFPIVFITGCSQGLLPHRLANDINEEKRLFYVGITRAEKELYLSHSDKYNDQEYISSQFIPELGDTIIRSFKNKKVKRRKSNR